MSCRLGIEQGIITETTKGRLMELEEERKKVEGEIGAESLRHPRMTREEILFGIDDLDDPFTGNK